MEISQEQRDRIYNEEKAKRGETGSRSNSGLLLFLTMAAVAGAAGFFALRKIMRSKDAGVNIDDLRRAYSGLSPEDEE